jgi:hypothetical protein
VTLKPDGDALAGSVMIGNFGGPEGQCVEVKDAPSPKHAMTISNARIDGSGNLTFQGSGNARFEMDLQGSAKAGLKMPGTPVEENPWQLDKQ